MMAAYRTQPTTDTEDEEKYTIRTVAGGYSLLHVLGQGCLLSCVCVRECVYTRVHVTACMLSKSRYDRLSEEGLVLQHPSSSAATTEHLLPPGSLPGREQTQAPC